MSENSKVTHVTTQPNKTTPVSIEVFRKGMEENSKFIQSVNNYYGGNTDEGVRFRTAAIEYVRKTPKLLETDVVSLMAAFVQSAQFRFLPSSVSGEAYIIPYGREAKFQLGYQGIVTLLYRTNKVVGITANIIYQNDQFQYEEGLEAKLKHIPSLFGKPRGEAIGVYTVAQMTGGAKTFKVMDKDGIMAIKELSKAKGSKDSPWNSDKDPELWMWKKTCLIQHSKLLPKTPELQKAIELDYEGEGLDKPNLNPSGPATDKATHAPVTPEPSIKDAEVKEPEFVPPTPDQLKEDEKDMR